MKGKTLFLIVVLIGGWLATRKKQKRPREEWMKRDEPSGKSGRSSCMTGDGQRPLKPWRVMSTSRRLTEELNKYQEVESLRISIHKGYGDI